MMDYDDDPDIENNKSVVEKKGDTSLSISNDKDLAKIAKETRRRINEYNKKVNPKETRVTTGVKKVFGKEINKRIAGVTGLNPMSIISPKSAVTRLELTHKLANIHRIRHANKSVIGKDVVESKGYRKTSRELSNLMATEVDEEHKRLFEVCLSGNNVKPPKKRRKTE